MPQGPSPSPAIRIAALILILSVILLEFPGARDLVEAPFSGIQTLNLTVQDVDPTGPNAHVDIRQGDIIRAVEGEHVRNYNHLRDIVQKDQALLPQRYTLERGGAEFTRTVRYEPAPPALVYRRFAYLLVGFTFLLMGLLVLLRRSDVLGVLFALNCAVLGFFVTDRPVVGAPWLQLSGELFSDAALLAFPALFLHFFLVFHDRPHRLSRRSSIRRMILTYAAPLLVYSASSFVTIRSFLGQSAPATLVQVFLSVSTLYIVVYLVASLILFVRNYRSSSSLQKQKLRIVIFGTIVGIVPFLVMIVWRQITRAPHDFWESLSVVFLGFISISFAYAILKHGVIELNIVLRRSVVYGLLTGVTIAAYYTVVNLVGEFLVSELHLRPVYLSAATILVLAVIFAPAREFVQRFTDRVFFRGEYDYKDEVVAFSHGLPRTLKRDDILGYFFARADTLLKASFVAFYAPSPADDEWVIEKSCGDTGPLPPVFPRESLVGRYSSRYRKPLMVEYLDRSWGARDLDRASELFIELSGAAVCMAIGGGEKVLGLAVLGRKRSGQLYSYTDAQLLERFGEHLALVLENAALHETTVEQERLKNEVLLARDIQLGLLPGEPPTTRGMQMRGKMVSSVEVGGDYFDYFALDSRRVGLSIGDGSGKGVPAAMLMASLRAVFKNLVHKDRMSPCELVTELNRYLCQNAEAEQFVTFFFGILDVPGQTFTFSNAGHCPALLVKGHYVDRLGEGGLPLGVDPDHGYKQGSVRLEAGDMLCLYTDGLVEQSGSSDEQYGEERLIRLLQTNKKLPLSELQELLFAAVLEFGGGRQDDDLTAIIARYEGS